MKLYNLGDKSFETDLAISSQVLESLMFKDCSLLQFDNHVGYHFFGFIFLIKSFNLPFISELKFWKNFMLLILCFTLLFLIGKYSRIVQFRSCWSCHSKAWEKEGNLLVLHSVRIYCETGINGYSHRLLEKFQIPIWLLLNQFSWWKRWSLEVAVFSYISVRTSYSPN